MSTIQRVAQVFGWVFVVIAIWGFFVSRGSMEADPALAPRVLGLFPVNVLHNLVHLAFGVWGIMAARTIRGAKTYALWAGGIYLVLTLLGLVIPTTFGLIPIGGNDIWLHALIAIVLLGAWASVRSDTTTSSTTTTTTTTTTSTTPPPTSSPGSSGPAASSGPTAPPESRPESRPGGPAGGGPGTGGPGTGGSTPGGSAGGPATGSPDRPASPPPPPPSSGEGDRRP